MDIENLLNDKPTQPLSHGHVPPLGVNTSQDQMSSVHLAPASSHHQHASSSSINFDSRNPGTGEYMTSYSPQSMQRNVGYSPQAGTYADGVSYPPNLASSDPIAANVQLPYDPIIEDRTRSAVADAAVQHGAGNNQMPSQRSNGEDALDGDDTMPKAFACGTCNKGFARRSDLVRHERIHSGVRPHICQHPGCGKQFIQRSALTVHERVHTKEKPHLCEKCGKPFSDSSSLARHRRIHSGTRPYQCPYADCQKTFTRRTTLTRHQNHHTGTVEEAAAARAAALAGQANAQVMDNAQPHPDPPAGEQEEQSQSDASSSVASYNPYANPMNAAFARPAPYQAQPSPSDYYPGPPSNPPQYTQPRPVAPGPSHSDIKVEQYPQPPGPSNVSNPWGQSPAEAATGQHSQATWNSSSSGRPPNPSDGYAYQGAYQGYR